MQRSLPEQSQSLLTHPAGPSIRTTKTLLVSLLLLPLLIALAACSKPPLAQVSATATSGPAPVSVSFTNNSQNADEFRWDFGDGTSATTAKGEAPRPHEYTKAGTYNVTLTANKKGGKAEEASTATVTVTVGPGPLHLVKLDPTDVTLEVAEAQAFTAKAFDQFDNPIPDLTYGFRSDKGAGQVDQAGNLTAATKAGSFDSGVTVEVTQGAITKAATAKVTLKPGPLAQVRIEPSEPSLEVSKAQQFAAKALDQFDNPIPGLTYSFRAERAAGQIDSAGNFTAATRAGTYDNAVTAEVTQGAVTKTASAKLTLKPGPLSAVKIDPTEATVEVAGTQRFSARASDQYDNAIPGITFAFHADKAAGQVDSSGNLTAATKVGSSDSGVTVEVIQGAVAKTASAKVTLKPGPLSQVKIDPAEVSLEVAKAQPFTAKAFDPYDNPIPALTYSFTSDKAAGQIDPAGNLTAATKVGTIDKGVTVEVTQGTNTKSATAKVTLKHGAVARVSLTPATATLNIGKTQQFAVEVVDAHGNAIPEAQVKWETAQGVGAVTDKGLLTAGTQAATFALGVKASATLDAASAQAMASVTVNPDPLSTVTLAPVQVSAGATKQLEAIATDQHGNHLTGLPTTWTVRNINAGSISSGGALTAGEVARSFADAIEVKVSQGELSRAAKATVAITPGPLEQLVVGPTPAEIGMGMTQQFVAAGADKYGNRISGLTFTWSVEASGGTIDAKGLFKAGSQPGSFAKTVKASATQGSVTKSATAGVTVLPDRIAFVSDRNDDQLDIYVMNADGTNVTRLTSTFDLEVVLSWSPDGRRLVFDSLFAGEIIIVGDDGQWEDIILPSDGSSGQFFPSWSPDGSRVAFTYANETTESEIYSGDVDGGRRTRLTNNTFSDVFPQWSPDGKKIAFVSDRDGNQEIYVMNADGSNQVRLTNNATDDVLPSWSPDGTEIVFQSGRVGPSQWAIYAMNADGTNVRQLTAAAYDARAPSYSADGKKVLFHGYKDSAKEQIYVFDKDTTNISRLTSNDFSDLTARWAPRKRGVSVNEASLVVPNTSALKALTVADVTAKARGAVVRIKTDVASGSGFLITSDGLVLTNNHVISDAKEITVFLDAGTSFKATIKGRDLVRDLALLKIEGKDLPFLEFGDMGQVPLGTDVLVVGYPLGTTDVTVTKGLMSAAKYDSGTNRAMMQTDSAVNAGNSGGPMLNLQGQVIGVVSSKISSAGVEGVGFAICISSVQTYLERLKAGETITS